MALTAKERDFLDFLEEFLRGKVYSKEQVVGIVLCCKDDERIDELMQFCNHNPNANGSDLLKKAIEIGGISQKIVIDED